MFKKTTLRYLFAAIMSFVIALTLAMPVTTIASEAGFFASDPNVNLAEGDKYMPMTINNVTINAGGRWYIKSEAEKKSCGSYVNFQKYIYF